jgi:hypothetical protein
MFQIAEEVPMDALGGYTGLGGRFRAVSRLVEPRGMES